MKSITSVLSLFTLMLGSSESGARASGNDECYELQQNPMHAIVSDLQVPQIICVDSLILKLEPTSQKPSNAVVYFSGVGLDGVLPATVNSSATGRLIQVLAFERTSNRGTCDEAASASLVMEFLVNSSGERTSDLKLYGFVSSTTDSCHSSGETEFLDYNRK